MITPLSCFSYVYWLCFLCDWEIIMCSVEIKIDHAYHRISIPGDVHHVHVSMLIRDVIFQSVG